MMHFDIRTASVRMPDAAVIRWQNASMHTRRTGDGTMTDHVMMSLARAYEIERLLRTENDPLERHRLQREQARAIRTASEVSR
jgi:hypothetical protein